MARRGYLPLRGVRVISFETAYSLPAGTRTLSELGAEVVRATAPGRVVSNYTTIVDGNALGKSCLGIDLKNPEGLALAKRLILQADVVSNNFRPSVMPGFGLGPVDLHREKPELIVLQLSGFGSPGPWEDYPAYGPSTEAAGGLNALVGRESDPPIRVGSGVYSDQLAGRYAALAVMAALDKRRRTGEGSFIDLSMTEGISHLIGNLLLSAALRGRRPERRGNRDAVFAPQGVYPAKGDDEWIAISIKSDDCWRSLIALVDDEQLRAPEFAAAANRRDRHDEIDAILRKWTAGFGKNELAERLQARGIAAGPVNKVSDFHFDPQLTERGFFQMVEHQRPIVGYSSHPHPTTPFAVEGRSRARLTDIRDLGQDNVSIVKRWLGIGPAEARRLHEVGALRAEPIQVDEAPPTPGLPRDEDFAERLGLWREETKTS